MTQSSESSESEASADSVDSFLRLVAAETQGYLAMPAVLRAGTVLNERFEVQSFARRGGMGAIHRGVDTATGALVAIKTMGRLGAGAHARFEREAQILAELQHPRIVRYLGHGTTPLPYLVMEWLEGEDLAERLQRAALTIEESFTLFRRTCEGLSLAHVRGIVHRDIKPANLFLCGGEPKSVKLLDFGIARLTEGTRSLTTDGVRIGTLGYMSPEQARGELDVDARADVFALGCVFYECLTGRAPFASAHAVGVLAKVLQEEPVRPSELRPELDPRADEFLKRLLHKNRKDRPADAAVVLREFHELSNSHRSPGARVRRSLSTRGAEQRIVSVILGRHGAAASEAPPLDAALQSIAAKFEARIAPLKGGAVLMVLSGHSEANDRASQAAWCALEIRQLRPELTLAVATGLADTSGSVPVGAAIDRAAALLHAGSSVEGVLLDEVTLGLVGLRFEVQRTGDVNVLLAARRDFDAPRMVMGRPTPCVGRDREMRTLDEALNECVIDSVSRAVIVMGPPGIGKSRLASEWLARGGRGGSVRTLFARPDPASAGSAWSLMQLLLRDAAALREADPREVQFERLREHLAGLLGERNGEHIVDFISEVIGLRRAQPNQNQLLLAARGNPEVMREQARRALHHWLDAEAANQPILIVIEDLHWGDMPSVAFIAEALREKPHRPLMVVALARPEAERQFPDFCERAIVRLRLPGLGPRAAQQLVDAVLTEKVDEDTVSRLVRVTEGNPFYLEELIRRIAAGSADWPETVMAMVQSRIERLDLMQRCVLRAASVFGERCWDAGIAAVLNDELDVPGTLALLIKEEILLEVPESRYVGAREYRFRHALFRDAAYAMMTHEDRCVAHGAAADWLERNEEKDARLLADHYEAAEAHERAGPWLLRAAKKALDAGDLLGTIELANRGVRVSAANLDHARFLLLRCYAQAVRGHHDLAITRQAVDLLPVGTPLWWLGLAVLMFGACIVGQPGEAAPYVALAREAPFRRERDVPLGQGLITLVGALVLLGKASVAEEILERVRASEADTQQPSDPVFTEFLAASQFALEAVAPIAGRWHLERAWRGCERSARALGSLGAVHGQSIVLYYAGIAAMHLGLYEKACEACSAASALAVRARSGLRDNWPELFLAKSLLRMNMPREALAAVGPIRDSQDFTVQQMLPVVIGEAQLQLGDLAAAEAEVAAACNGTSPRLQRLAACVLARAQLMRGETTLALRTIELATQAPTSNGLESEIDLMNLRTECLLACAQPDAAKRLAARTHQFVMQLASDVHDPQLKQSFLERVQPCARAVALYEQLS